MKDTDITQLVNLCALAKRKSATWWKMLHWTLPCCGIADSELLGVRECLSQAISLIDRMRGEKDG